MHYAGPSFLDLENEYPVHFFGICQMDLVRFSSADIWRRKGSAALLKRRSFYAEQPGKFFRVIAGRDFDRIPLFLSLCDQLIERLRTERGVEDYREYYNIPFAYAAPPVPSIRWTIRRIFRERRWIISVNGETATDTAAQSILPIMSPVWRSLKRRSRCVLSLCRMYWRITAGKTRPPRSPH